MSARLLVFAVVALITGALVLSALRMLGALVASAVGSLDAVGGIPGY